MRTTNSDTPSGLVELAVLSTCLGSPNTLAQTERLVARTDRVVQLRPDEIEWSAMRGAALYRDGKFATAVRAADSAATARP